MAKKYFNLIRKQGRAVTIFRRNLIDDNAFSQLKHWKKLARNSGGHVYFELVEVPYELTPKAFGAARETDGRAAAAAAGAQRGRGERRGALGVVRTG